ncbi:hypothetical protein [Rhodospirillum sp. A1_3_36]|uniref:hypothetical protein n=1 Tax=Rhodospirillum sp. A1_3_36 TaxID=3391666 RepID=UPI0039A6768B
MAGLKPSGTGSCSILVMLAFCLCLVNGRLVFAQDKGWISSAFIALRHLVDQRVALRATLYPAIDTEVSMPGMGLVDVVISRDAPEGGRPSIPKGSKILCRYQPVRGGTRIPMTCDRILTPEGGDFRVKATVHGRDGQPGIPADGIKSNGALLADQAKPLLLYLDDVLSVGLTGGPQWSRQ